MHTTTALSLAGALSLGFFLGTKANVAQQERQGETTRDVQEAGMPAGLAEMMEKAAIAGTPGEHHKQLDAFVGTWDAEGTMWMDPSMPPMEFAGTLESEWTFDGRYVEGTYEGDMMGQPFEGRSMYGYDNAAGEFCSSWVDNSSTTMMVSRGQMTEDGAFQFEGDAICPMTGGPCHNEEIVVIDGPDQYTSTMYSTRDGVRSKAMEIVFTRSE